MKFILDVNAYFLALRARMMPITAPLPLIILSRIGRCEGQVNWHEPQAMQDVTSSFFTLYFIRKQG